MVETCLHKIMKIPQAVFLECVSQENSATLNMQMSLKHQVHIWSLVETWAQNITKIPLCSFPGMHVTRKIKMVPWRTNELKTSCSQLDYGTNLCAKYYENPSHSFPRMRVTRKIKMVAWRPY